ncbi:hypothetical protein F4779DRAFT_622618 [Xylariaceae sp. FL0662B]|nr:hypothetical protein F4779DRAFT_622618 [Xylariaceae sp. FL0662B]
MAEYWSYPPIACDGGPDIAVVTGRLGDGVLGPLDDVAEVKEDWESPFELAEDPIELTRGDEVLEEYAKVGCGRGSEGSRSLTYGERWIQLYDLDEKATKG